MSLLTSFSAKYLELKNRIVMAPMTRQRADNDGNPTDIMATYYEQRASAGLIITEATPISPYAVGYANIPGIYSDSHIEGWKKVTESVHKKGGKIFLQLWHVGRISHPFFLPNNDVPMAPSAVQPSKETPCYTSEGKTSYPMPREMTHDDIKLVVQQFIDGAKNALAAGFDGVEVHSANGYLIDQFLRDKTNRRADEYGGSVANRCRFLNEVVTAVVNAIGNDKVGVRISPINTFNDMDDSDPQTLFNSVVELLNDFDLAFLHVAEGVIGDVPPKPFDFHELKSKYSGVYMANGGYSQSSAEAALSSNRADLVAFGAPFISNPDLVERFGKNAELNEVDYSTCYGGDAKGYIDYPMLSNS